MIFRLLDQMTNIIFFFKKKDDLSCISVCNIVLNEKTTLPIWVYVKLYALRDGK